MGLLERDCQAMAEVMETLVPGFLENSRQQDKAAARKVVIYTLRKMGYTTISIGKIMHKDHTTVVYSCKYVKSVLDAPRTDPKLMHIYNQFRKQYYQQ